MVDYTIQREQLDLHKAFKQEKADDGTKTANVAWITTWEFAWGNLACFHPAVDWLHYYANKDSFRH